MFASLCPGGSLSHALTPLYVEMSVLNYALFLTLAEKGLSRQNMTMKDAFWYISPVRAIWYDAYCMSHTILLQL